MSVTVESPVTQPLPPFLSPSSRLDEVLLRRYADGDLDARERLVRRHMPMASRLAARYRNTSETREDLEQVAYVGLLKTIDRYDPALGSFVGYAVTTIRGELKRHFRDLGWGIHVTRPLQERYLRVTGAMDTLTSTLGRSPTPRDLAAKTGLTIEEVVEALDVAHGYAPRSLDAPIGSEDDETRSLGDTLGKADCGYANVELGQAVGPAFRELPEREQQIIRMRFVEDLTQSEIATQMGVSQMHVSRLLRRSLTKLSEVLDAP